MHHFRYVGQNLCCESVDLAEVARLYGTPTYVYSAATMADNYTRLARSLGGLDAQVCFAMKANSSLAVLRHFSRLGAAFDLVSGGEIRRVLAAGADVRRSVFAGVGKTEGEMRLALEQGIFSFHVESEPELARLNHVAGQLGVKAPVAIRVNPDVDAHTHAKITTGKSDNKFGIPLAHAAAAYAAAAKFPHLQIKGVQIHIGSQLTSVAPFVEELTFRGVGYSLLARYGRWTSILIVGACFALDHGLVQAFPELFIFGCALAWLRSNTTSVFPGLLLHATFNSIALVAAVAT
jgi:diaminopimelate decarboxylase